MADRIPQPQDKFIVRLPDGMRDRIRESAEANNRSMNAEIVARLEASFQPEPSATTLQAVINQLVESGEVLIQRFEAVTKRK